MKCLRIILIALVSLSACAKTKEKSTHSGTIISPGVGKLPLSDLAKQSGLATMTSSEVETFMLLRRGDFLATEEAAKDCFSEIFDQATLQASGEKIVLDVNINMSGCVTRSYTDAGIRVEISKALYSFYIEKSCVGTDLSSYDGKLAEELADVPECAENLFLSNTSSEVSGTFYMYNRKSIFSTKTIESSSTEANEPCLVTQSDGNYTQDGCISIRKFVSAIGFKDEYSRSTAHSHTWTASPYKSWFTSGTTTVEVGDWTGTVTYAGAATDPGYSMSRGLETTAGTLTMPVGTAIVERSN